MNNINKRGASEIMLLTTIFLLGFLCFPNNTGRAQTLESPPMALNWKSSDNASNVLPAKEAIPKPQLPIITTITPSSDNIVRRAMSCDVVFGSSLTTCKGTGICQITARKGLSQPAMEQKQGCQGTVGLQSQIDGGKGVSLLLRQVMLCPQFYKTHLQNGMLIQENPCKLSMDVIETLGLKISELPIGKYPVKEENGFLKIDFRIPDGTN